MAMPSMAAFTMSRGGQWTARGFAGRASAVARRRQGAAPAMRAHPTRSGLGGPSRARRAITLPVVPHVTAARQTRASPSSIASVVYGSGGVPSVIGRAVSGIYRMAVARGMGELDHIAGARRIEEWAGIELRSQSGDRA